MPTRGSEALSSSTYAAPVLATLVVSLCRYGERTATIPVPTACTACSTLQHCHAPRPSKCSRRRCATHRTCVSSSSSTTSTIGSRRCSLSSSHTRRSLRCYVCVAGSTPTTSKRSLPPSPGSCHCACSHWSVANAAVRLVESRGLTSPLEALKLEGASISTVMAAVPRKVFPRLRHVDANGLVFDGRDIASPQIETFVGGRISDNFTELDDMPNLRRCVVNPVSPSDPSVPVSDAAMQRYLSMEHLKCLESLRLEWPRTDRVNNPLALFGYLCGGANVSNLTELDIDHPEGRLPVDALQQALPCVERRRIRLDFASNPAAIGSAVSAWALFAELSSLRRLEVTRVGSGFQPPRLPDTFWNSVNGARNLETLVIGGNGNLPGLGRLNPRQLPHLRHVDLTARSFEQDRGVDLTDRGTWRFLAGLLALERLTVSLSEGAAQAAMNDFFVPNGRTATRLVALHIKRGNAVGSTIAALLATTTGLRELTLYWEGNDDEGTRLDAVPTTLRTVAFCNGDTRQSIIALERRGVLDRLARLRDLRSVRLDVDNDADDATFAKVLGVLTEASPRLRDVSVTRPMATPASPIVLRIPSINQAVSWRFEVWVWWRVTAADDAAAAAEVSRKTQHAMDAGESAGGQ